MSAGITIVDVKENFTYKITDEDLIKNHNTDDDQIEWVRAEIKRAIKILKTDGIFQREGYSPVFFAVLQILNNCIVKDFKVAEWSDLIININTITGKVH